MIGLAADAASGATLEHTPEPAADHSLPEREEALRPMMPSLEDLAPVYFTVALF